MSIVLGKGLLQVDIQDNTKSGLNTIDKNTSKTVDNLEKKFSNLGKTIVGVFAGTQLISAMKSLGTASLSLAGDLDDFASGLDLNTKNLASLSFAGTKAGVDMTKLQNIFIALNDKIGNARDGSKSAQQAFEKLGIDFSTISLENAVDSILKLGSEGKLTGDSMNALNDIIGKKLSFQVVKLSGEVSGFADANRQAMDSNALFTNESISNLAKLGDKWDALKFAMQVSFATGISEGLGTTNTKELERTITELTKSLGSVLVKIAQFGKGTLEVANTGVGKLVLATTLLAFLINTSLINGLTKAILIMGAFIKQLIIGKASFGLLIHLFSKTSDVTLTFFSRLQALGGLLLSLPVLITAAFTTAIILLNKTNKLIDEITNKQITANDTLYESRKRVIQAEKDYKKNIEDINSEVRKSKLPLKEQISLLDEEIKRKIEASKLNNGTIAFNKKIYELQQKRLDLQRQLAEENLGKTPKGTTPVIPEVSEEEWQRQSGWFALEKLKGKVADNVRQWIELRDKIKVTAAEIIKMEPVPPTAKMKFDEFKKQFESIMSYISPITNTISNVFDIMSGFAEAKIDKIQAKLDTLRSDWDAEKAKIDELGLQNTDYAKAREEEFKRNEKRLQAETKAQWKRSQNLQVQLAYIQAIQGSLNAFTSSLQAPWPLNMILAPINSAIALAAGMANVAKIKATPAPKFAQGGIVKGSPYRDGTPVLAMGGEAFINRQATEANRNAIEFMNRGGKIGQGNGMTIQINGDVIGTQDFVEKNLIPAFEKAYKRNVQMAFAK